MCLIGLYQKYDAYNDNAELDDFYEYMDLYEKMMTSTNSKKKDIVNVCASYFATLLHPSCNNKSKRACYDKVVDIIEYIVENDSEITFNNTEHCETNELENEKDVELLNDEHYELAKSELVSRNFKMLKLLIEHGMSVNSHDSLILRTAYKAGDIDWIDYFISKGAKLRDESDGFEEACESDKVEVLQHWMKNGGVVPMNPEYPCINMACLKGNFDMVKLLVENGVDLSDPEYNGVRIACRLGLKRTLKYLLNNNAVVGDNCRYQLERVCVVGDIGLVKMILEYYDGLGVLEMRENTNTKDGELKNVSWLDDENTDCVEEYKITKTLLKNGEPIQNSDLFDRVIAAVILANIEILKLLLSYNFDSNIASKILKFAVQLENIDVVKALLENDLSPKDDSSIIDIAFKTNNSEIVRLLLQYGAKIGKYSSELTKYLNLNGAEKLQLILNYCPEIDGASYLLQDSIRENYVEVVRLLLKHTVTLENDRYDCIFYACKSNNLEILELLIEKGAKIQKGQSSGIIQACKRNNLEILKLLLERIPNLVLKNNYGLREAIEQENAKMIKLVINYGTDTSEHIESIMEVANELNEHELINICKNMNSGN